MLHAIYQLDTPFFPFFSFYQTLASNV